jgi:transcriptional antiterminator Rof (Rho-off)
MHIISAQRNLLALENCQQSRPIQVACKLIHYMVELQMTRGLAQQVSADPTIPAAAAAVRRR